MMLKSDVSNLKNENLLHPSGCISGDAGGGVGMGGWGGVGGGVVVGGLPKGLCS